MSVVDQLEDLVLLPPENYLSQQVKAIAGDIYQPKAMKGST